SGLWPRRARAARTRDSATRAGPAADSQPGEREAAESLWSVEARPGSSQHIRSIERVRVLGARKKRLQAPLDIASSEKHTVATFKTAQADVCADADDAPVVAGAGMRLAQ